MPKSAINDIVLIGTGNVAANLLYALLDNNKKIVRIFGRSEANAKILSDIAGCSFTDRLSELDVKADLFIIAVPDEKIKEVAAKLNVKSGILVHTAGSVDMDVLKNASSHTGVLYPLQTLDKHKRIDFFNKVPLCIEAGDDESRGLLKDLAGLLSGNVVEMNSEQRRIVHLAAVFVNNFVNYLHLSASELLKKADISPDILKQLIAETSDIKDEKDIFKKLTGPAVRHDFETIEKHRKMLDKYPELKNVYEVITENILKNGIL